MGLFSSYGLNAIGLETATDQPSISGRGRRRRADVLRDDESEKSAKRGHHHREQQHGERDVHRLVGGHQSLPRPSANKEVEGQVMQPSDEDHFPVIKEAHHDFGRGHVAAKEHQDVEEVGQHGKRVCCGKRGQVDPLVAQESRRSLMGGDKPHHEPKGENVEAGEPEEHVDEGDHVKPTPCS